MANRALQLFGGAATTVVLAACYGGPDVKGTDSGPGTGPTTGATTGATSGTSSGGTTLGDCGAPSTEFAVSVVWNDDGLVPSDSDGDGLNDTGCDGDTVDICVQDPLGVATWRLGMVEDGAQGWSGEDCFNGYAAYNTCHTITAPQDSISEVCTPGEVADGATLLDAAKDPFLTYYLDDLGGACIVFGTDPAYYATLGCTEMM